MAAFSSFPPARTMWASPFTSVTKARPSSAPAATRYTVPIRIPIQTPNQVFLLDMVLSST